MATKVAGITKKQCQYKPQPQACSFALGRPTIKLAMGCDANSNSALACLPLANLKPKLIIATASNNKYNDAIKLDQRKALPRDNGETTIQQPQINTYVTAVFYT